LLGDLSLVTRFRWWERSMGLVCSRGGMAWMRVVSRAGAATIETKQERAIIDVVSVRQRRERRDGGKIHGTNERLISNSDVEIARSAICIYELHGCHHFGKIPRLSNCASPTSLNRLSPRLPHSPHPAVRGLSWAPSGQSCAIIAACP
jgi:hypothetical protein